MKAVMKLLRASQMAVMFSAGNPFGCAVRRPWAKMCRMHAAWVRTARSSLTTPQANAELSEERAREIGIDLKRLAVIRGVSEKEMS